MIAARALSISIFLVAAGSPTLAAQQDLPAGLVERPFVVGVKPVALPGTLTLPEGKGPFPAVVLVHGSGPNDRDETISANKPFRDLAWGLAQRGIAVARYEKRTRAAPFFFLGRRYTVDDETVNDALLVAALLRSDPAIDPSRIVIVGHSQGAMFAPRIGQRDTALAGLVLLAGAATANLAGLIERQIRYLDEHSDSSSIAQGTAGMGSMLPKIRAVTAADTASNDLVAGAPASYWYSMLNYDMVAASRSAPQPMLVLQGGRDYQVTVADLEQWKAAVGSRPNTTTKVYPSLNHLFIAGEGPSVPAEYSVPGHVSTEVIDDIAAWIKSLRRPAGGA